MNNSVYHIYPMNTINPFDRENAYRVLNVIMSLSSKSKAHIDGLKAQLDYHQNSNLKKYQEIQVSLAASSQKWNEKVRRLGAFPCALFEVKIPTTGGYFYWQHPNSDFSFIEASLKEFKAEFSLH